MQVALRVAVLGASDKPDRYAYMAVERLLKAGHTVFPVSPTVKTVQGLAVLPSLADLPPPIDTLSLYVNPKVSAQMADQILALAPRRILFNPGTENPALMQRARAQGIDAIEACTLVLLSTGQF